MVKTIPKEAIVKSGKKTKKVSADSAKNKTKKKDSQGVSFKGIGDVGNIMTPEGVIMLIVAIFFDVGELLVELIPVVGWIISALMDVVAFIFFGIWMKMRGSNVKATKKMTAKIGKAAKWAKRIKWMKPVFVIIELLPIPYFGSLLPLWILLIYFELVYNS